MARVKNILLSMFGGTLAGVGLGLCPHLGFFSELRNFQIVLLELSYQALTRLVPPGVMRALGTAAGELGILAAIGAVIGLGAGVLLYGAASPLSRRWSISAVVVSLSATVGIFVAMFGTVWCRIVLIHANRRMVSPEGLGMVLGSLGIGCVVGLGFLLVLRWLSRYRLEKACVAGGLLVLVVGYVGVPPVRGAHPLNPQRALGDIEHVVLLGADGATWDVALPMIKEGRLPHLAKLMERGAWGDLRTTLPWISPVVWTSIATGKRERLHGIHGFVVRDQETQEVVPVSVGSRKVKAVWDIVSDAGLRVDVINWYAGWPAEPINGTMVSRRFWHSDLPSRVSPEERTGAIDELVRRFKDDGIRRDEAIVAEVGLSLLELDRPHLHLLYLREIDNAQHRAWRYHATRRGSRLAQWLYGPADPAELATAGRQIEEAYERLDAVLGRIVQLSGPQTVIMLASDHGAGIKAPGKLHFTLNPLLEQWGLLRYLPDGRTIDWTQTTLYDSTKRRWHEQRELFINQRPEGPFGQRLSEEAQRQQLQVVVQRLNELTTDAGKPVVRETALRTSRGEALHVVARMNVRLEEHETVRGSGIQLPVSQLVSRTPRTGTHRAPGLLVMAGPGIRSGYRIRAASILDITPTLLYLLERPVADDMEGRVLLEVIEPTVRRAMPVRMVATYETGSERAPRPAQQSVADEELLERLRSLGYIQ